MIKIRRRNARKVAKLARALAALGEDVHTPRRTRRRAVVSLNG